MYKLIVYYEDTDAAGVVYYANYLKFLERARTQLLFKNGFTHTLLKKKFDIITVVKSCQIEFIKPAKLDDELIIKTLIVKKSKIQVFFDQNIYCNTSLIAKSNIRIAAVNTNGKISRMPQVLFDIF